MADENKLEQKSKDYVAGAELRDLILSSGISGISGREVGYLNNPEDFNEKNLSMLPEGTRTCMYHDILQFKNRFVPKYRAKVS